jgi:type III pantothenate kinase
MTRLLLVDIGNTSTSVAVCAGRRILTRKHREGGYTALADVLRIVREVAPVEDVVISSVVPSANAVWVHAARLILGRRPLVVSSRVRMPIRIRYPLPHRIGADRLADAVGAFVRCRKAVIVADFGTAATFDVITSEGEFIGGVIAPGPGLFRDYLADRTALLPRIALDGRRCEAIGRSTEGAMWSGCRAGYRGMVDSITDHLLAGVVGAHPVLIATGGYAAWSVRDTRNRFKVVPDLMLHGMRVIYEAHRKTEGERGVR